jgi:hypothetical protein
VGALAPLALYRMPVIGRYIRGPIARANDLLTADGKASVKRRVQTLHNSCDIERARLRFMRFGHIAVFVKLADDLPCGRAFGRHRPNGAENRLTLGIDNHLA